MSQYDRYHESEGCADDRSRYSAIFPLAFLGLAVCVAVSVARGWL